MASKKAQKGTVGSFLSSATTSGLGSAKLKGYDDEGGEVKKQGGREDVAANVEEGSSKQEERKSLWKILQKYIGSDISSLVKFPISFFEPMSTLQKLAEIMEYSHLLDLANECEDPHMRLVYASTWAITIYYAAQRTWLPFNPILGETYEMVNHNGITFLAEQVCHHPPVGVAHAENEHFTYDFACKLKTKLLGNSFDYYPLGRTRITLKRDGALLDLAPPRTKINNLIFGRTWIDTSGDMIMTNMTTGDRVVLNFKPCGWFGACRYEVNGYVYNAAKEPKMLMTGKWNKSMSYQPCDMHGVHLPGIQLKEVWKVADVPQNDKFQYTYFAHKINSFDTAPKKLLASDSRLRPDRYALEKGDLSKVGPEKNRLEVRQRNEKKKREANGDKYTPKWFGITDEVTITPWGEMETYEYNGKYSKHRSMVNSSSVSSDEVGVVPTKFNPWQYVTKD
ncbi:hypothetical protein MKX03_034956 [Papaver bracteatum]|nr:hypothetical protein MKX03_034956 [Papaver bracteatum]